MNIYDIFRIHSPNSPVNRKKLREIQALHCPNLPINLLEAHRKIYHLQLQLRYWRPLVRKAKESTVGGFIDNRGVIRNTEIIYKNRYSEQVCYPYICQEKDKQNTKYKLLNSARKSCYKMLSDRRYNLVFINEHTVPKWCPKSLTICLDLRTELLDKVTAMLTYRFIVLRLKELTPNQYEIWLFDYKKKELRNCLATILGDSISLSKTPSGGKRSAELKVSKKVTESLK